jgi:hypothetical protein
LLTTKNHLGSPRSSKDIRKKQSLGLKNGMVQRDVNGGLVMIG